AGGALDAHRLTDAAAAGDRRGRRHAVVAAADALPDAGAVQLLRPPRAAAVRRRASALSSGSRACQRPDGVFRERALHPGVDTPGSPYLSSALLCRSTLPARTSVYLPSSIAALPLTNRYFTPVAYWCGLSYVALSRYVSGSNTTTSA